MKSFCFEVIIGFLDKLDQKHHQSLCFQSDDYFGQWNKIYCNHLNTRLVCYLNGRFVSGCRMVRYSNGGLKTGLKSLFMVQNVQYLNGRPSHGLYHLNTGHPYWTVFR